MSIHLRGHGDVEPAAMAALGKIADLNQLNASYALVG
jgi:hypothetical protein